MHCNQDAHCPCVYVLRFLGYSASSPAGAIDATGLLAVQIAIVESFSLSYVPSYIQITNIFGTVQGSDLKV
jgi:hypothetical protein